MKYLVFLIFVFMSSIVFADPYIESVSGDIEDGENITVFGEGFGSKGPDIVLFDNFNRGNAGEEFSTDATIGQWDTMGGFVWEDSALSHGKGARCVISGGTKINRKQFSESSEIYVSSMAYIPDGYRFPNTTGEETWYSTDGGVNVKHLWVYYGSNGYVDGDGPDIYTPTQWNLDEHDSVSRRTFHSNDKGVFRPYDEHGWEWDHPVRWSTWIKGSPTNDPSETEGFFQGVTPSEQHYHHYDESNMEGQTWFSEEYDYGTEDGPPYAFDRISVPGYIRGDEYPPDNYVIDDVYVAIGPGAAARVEIGNNSVYTDCTKLAISTVDSWSNNKINLTLRTGNFKKDEDAYLFVVDAENNPSIGYPISLEELYPPEDLNVNGGSS